MKERVIDANALMDYCKNQKSKTIDCDDIARFPTCSTNEWHYVENGDLPKESISVLILSSDDSIDDCIYIYIFHVRDSKILYSAHGIIPSLGLRKKKFYLKRRNDVSIIYDILAYSHFRDKGRTKYFATGNGRMTYSVYASNNDKNGSIIIEDIIIQ